MNRIQTKYEEEEQRSRLWGKEIVRSELILYTITTHYLFNIVTLFQTLLIRYKCIPVHCFVSFTFFYEQI